MTTCLHCKFWNRPENWEGWSTYVGPGKTVPYDWSTYSSECSKLPDIDHIEVCLDIHGNANVDVEIMTCGTFGCTLGEERDQE